MIKFFKEFKENWKLSKVKTILLLASSGLGIGYIFKDDFVTASISLLLSICILNDFGEINMKKDIKMLQDKIKELENR